MLWRWSVTCSHTRTSQVRGPSLVPVPCREGTAGARLYRQPQLSERRHQAARGLLPGGSFPAFPLARPGPSEEQAAFKAHCSSSHGAEPSKPAAESRQQQLPADFGSETIIKSVLPSCLTLCKGMEVVPPAPHIIHFPVDSKLLKPGGFLPFLW